MYKNLTAVVLTGLMTLTFSVSSRAADGLYLGLAGGVMDLDRGGFDDARNAGVTLGYEFLGVGLGDIAVEGTYTTSADKGDAPGGQEWEIKTLSVYGALRSAGPVYLKAKAGFSSNDIEIGGDSDNNTDFSAGLGAGLSIGIAQFELEYTRIEDNVSFVGVSLLLMTPF